MALLSSLFRTNKPQSVALIDVGPASIAAGYASYSTHDLPVLHYSKRTHFEPHAGETDVSALERAFRGLGEALTREGAPALLRATGSGAVDMVLVSLSTPWQKTIIHTEQIEDTKPFVFTEEVEAKTIQKSSPTLAENEVLAYEASIGTILNGYEVREPYGKKVSRASVVILSSIIDRSVSEAVTRMLSQHFHTKKILFTSSAALRSLAIKAAFPHEQDYVLLDASGPHVTTALVRHGLLVAIDDIPRMNAETGKRENFSQRIAHGLETLSKQFPLPHAMFLIALENRREHFKDMLTRTHLGSLWLSEEPPTVIAIAPPHLSQLIKASAEEAPDLLIELMALYGRISIAREL